MKTIARKTNRFLTSQPLNLTWTTKFPSRTISTTRAVSSPSSPSISDHPAPPAAVAGQKLIESFTEEFEVGSRLITFETGKIARFANGAVVIGMDRTKVLSTVCSSKGDAVGDFLPLTVDYQERQFAQGLIPGTFTRREGAPKERELLCGRIIDRPIRPLFPAGFYHEVQVTASVLSSDGEQDPNTMAANATSAALMLSDIPWGGPIGVIRIGRINGAFIVNPSMDELSLSDLNLVYACTRDKTLMIDVQAQEISEKDLKAGLRLAHPEAVKYIEPQIKLAAKAGKSKKEYKLSMISDVTMEKVKKMAEKPIEAVFTDPSYGKFERGEALDKITQEVKRTLEEECDEESLKVLPKAVDTVRKKVVRRRIITEGLRVDGRRLEEVRPVFCETRYLPIPHGSAIFSRGETQVLCAVTVGAPGDAQRLDSLVGPPTKRFMLHYTFPPYSINEVGKRGGLNRREVGHGSLAEKALLAVLPSEADYPYTIRINSEVMSSDGSTSMATVCGASMAMMDAGIPLREHVAGVSVGLVSEVDPSTGTIEDYRIVTDILGLEDHLGDMDFKIAGTRNGITAIQLDIKPAGIPLDIICESLNQATKGRLQILDHMQREINAPRSQDDLNSPRLATLKFSNDCLRRLIGPQGVLKREIEEQTGARMSVSNGTLTIAAKNQSIMEKVLDKVDFVIGREIVIGGIYKGVVNSVKEFGAFVEFNGGQQGLLHISELSHELVSRVSDVVSLGDQISVMCIGQDVRGNIKLSLKAIVPQSGSVKKQDVAKGPIPHIEEVLNKNELNAVDPFASSVPVIMIRSAAECDEEEKSAGLTESSRVPNVKKSKSPLNTSSQDNSNKSKKSKSLKNTNQEKSNKKKDVVATPVTEKTLKLGNKVTAAVYQIRAHGLVLDLGGGIRGMYRFETNGKRDFEVGDELEVECESFTSKGIPVMTLVED